MLPESIKEIQKASRAQRGRLIERYLACARNSPANRAQAVPAASAPAYMRGYGLTESHVKRTEMELAGCLPDAGARLYTRSMVTTFALDNEAGSLTEVSIAALSKPLEVRANLHVAAAFFSAMVASADDYLDTEGSYSTYGKELFYVTHAYRDLIDLALQDEVDSGALTPKELKSVRAGLGEVLTSLIKSEETTDAAQYLYRKSCGDKVVSVLFPASAADKETKEACAQIGRRTGEAGQLIDDILDYGYDLENSKKNYIIMNGASIADAIEGAQMRVNEATRIAEKRLKGYEPVSWVLKSLNEVVTTIKERHLNGQPSTPSTLPLSNSVGALLNAKMPAEQLLVWF